MLFLKKQRIDFCSNKTSRPAMCNPRPSWAFCAAQFRFAL